MSRGIRMWRGTVEGEPFLTGRTMIVAGSNARVLTRPCSIAEPHRPTVDHLE
jgi:hypothetical protein